MANKNGKQGHETAALVVSIVAICISAGSLLFTAGNSIYNVWNTENAKRPWIEAVCQPIKDNDGVFREVISVTNKGGHIEGCNIEGRALCSFYIQKLSENRTTVTLLTPAPLQFEISYYFNRPTYTTEGNLIATAVATNPTKLSSLLQDVGNMAAREGYICTGSSSYTMIVTYMSNGLREYYWVPENFGTSLKYSDYQIIKDAIDLGAKNAGSFGAENNTLPVIDNITGERLWYWCKGQVIK